MTTAKGVGGGGEQQQKEAAASGGENAQENGDGTAAGCSKEDDG